MLSNYSALDPSVHFLQKVPVYKDDRGFFTECFDVKEFNFPEVVQTNLSESCEGVVRGMHFNTLKPQAKFIRVLQGAIIDCIIDLRYGSPIYGQVKNFEVNNIDQCLLVPAGFAHGFMALADNTRVLYGCSELYDPQNDTGISVLDDQFDFPWFKVNRPPIATDKDKNWPIYDLEKVYFKYDPNKPYGCDLAC